MKTVYKAIPFICLLAVFAFLPYGCATLFHGSTDKMDLSSDPSGAKVFVNGHLMGNTPIQLNLTSKHTYTIEFRKDGFENRTVVVNASVGGGWVILDILGGLLPVIIDAATGDWYSLDQDHVNAALEKQQGGGAVETPSPSSEESKEAETPSNITYSKLGPGHWIKSVSKNGKAITLEDSSRWEIDPADAQSAAAWPNATPISVGKPGGSYPYQLIDASQNKAVHARYKGQ